MSAFGVYLRAVRLGYRWVPALGAWMHVEAGGPPWRVCLATDAKNMGAQTRDAGQHVCWWEGDPDGSAIVGTSPALRSAVGAAPCELLIDDEGIEVTP